MKERNWCEQQELQKERFNKIQAQFLHVFRKDKAPCKKRAHAWLKKFDAHWTVKNLNKKSNSRAAQSGLKKVHDEATIEGVRHDAENSPKRGIRNRSRVLSLSRRTPRRVLRIDLGKYSYHIQTMSNLLAYDRRHRLAKAGALMEKIDVN